ncbi:hypothetical protein M427DRAFT_30779 [Gonapodya prolifera JEL478]|uniref:Crinkler effector protein N-terminal domain-containing protein n=1 Tax=Gonapodya prolifera (strain JEL478) TaxID=1344416 RepID=A0A139AJL7_GONPJ|nr:hypothetical protein M427DRAFT_30779 [Gonapodya prolifera JEL478]|eukprot:KXS16949.1 hypothetical protein M427DRAFT_30779 [Gonapodya prolifera JEL478]
MAASTITLACLLLGETVPFEVFIDPSSSVNTLKKAIKKELAHSLSGVDAYTLALWKVNIPYAARASITEDTLKEEDVMGPLKKVSFYFPDQGSEEHIRVVVRRPQVKRLREDNEEKAASFPASEVSSAVMTKAMQHLKLMELPKIRARLLQGSSSRSPTSVHGAKTSGTSTFRGACSGCH